MDIAAEGEAKAIPGGTSVHKYKLQSASHFFCYQRIPLPMIREFTWFMTAFFYYGCKRVNFNSYFHIIQCGIFRR